MPEAEVGLRLSFWLLKNQLVTSSISVAIDGAQVKTGDTVLFELREFLEKNGWRRDNGQGQSWQGTYCHADYDFAIQVHSKSGCGDVVATLSNKRKLRVEAKKGPLIRSTSSQEYPLLREALGQLLTISEVEYKDIDILAVAVPHSKKFDELAQKWKKAPLVNKLGILIATVDRNNDVTGLETLFDNILARGESQK